MDNRTGEINTLEHFEEKLSPKEMEHVSALTEENVQHWLKNRRKQSHGTKLKIGRNELCPCGSKIKFKKCHWTPSQTSGVLTR